MMAPFSGSSYPWRMHAAVLMPLLLLMLWVGLTYGWWGEPVRMPHEQARIDFPIFTSVMHIITSWASPLLYAVYVALFVRAAHTLGRTATQNAVYEALKGVLQPMPTNNHAEYDLRLAIRYIFYALTITLITTQAFKFGLGMPRPGSPWPPQPWLFSMSYNSFPSGHTTEIVATALPLAFRSRWAALGLALLVALVGYSRIWLGRHHPIDILAGMIFGSLAAWLTCRMARPTQKN